MESVVCLEVVVLLANGSMPTKYGLSLDMEKARCIPPALARVAGLPPSNLVLVDIVQSQVGTLHTSAHTAVAWVRLISLSE